MNDEIYIKAIITDDNESGVDVSTEYHNCDSRVNAAILISLLEDFANDHTLDKTVELFQSFLHYFNTKEKTDENN